jgi:HEAT repeat protein
MLGSVNGDEALFALIETLQNDEAPEVREAAAYALGDKRDERALPALTEALYDEKLWVQQAAITAIQHIGSPQSIQPLIDYIRTSSDINQMDAIEALRAVGGAEAVEPLISLYYIVDSNSRDEIVRMLTSIGSDATETLAAALSTGTPRSRYNAASILVQVDSNDTEQAFRAALDRGDTAVIAGAYQYYIRLGRSGSEDLLVQALNEFGNADMAETYLNSNNAQLEEAARHWAAAKGYTVSTNNRNKDYPIWGEG